MGFINLGRLNIRKRNSCASALVSLSDVQPPSVYKSHILNGLINKLYLLFIAEHIRKSYLQYCFFFFFFFFQISEQAIEKCLYEPLQALFPTMEYLLRAGWTPDGK